MIHRFKKTSGIGPNDDLEFEENGGCISGKNKGHVPDSTWPFCIASGECSSDSSHIGTLACHPISFVYRMRRVRVLPEPPR